MTSLLPPTLESCNNISALTKFLGNLHAYGAKNNRRVTLGDKANPVTLQTVLTQLEKLYPQASPRQNCNDLIKKFWEILSRKSKGTEITTIRQEALQKLTKDLTALLQQESLTKLHLVPLPQEQPLSDFFTSYVTGYNNGNVSLVGERYKSPSLIIWQSQIQSINVANEISKISSYWIREFKESGFTHALFKILESCQTETSAIVDLAYAYYHQDPGLDVKVSWSYALVKDDESKNWKIVFAGSPTPPPSTPPPPRHPSIPSPLGDFSGRIDGTVKIFFENYMDVYNKGTNLQDYYTPQSIAVSSNKVAKTLPLRDRSDTSMVLTNFVLLEGRTKIDTDLMRVVVKWYTNTNPGEIKTFYFLTHLNGEPLKIVFESSPFEIKE